MKFKTAANAVLSGVKMERAAAGECVKVRPVSYTHLTLPTILLV